jgi:hypothetical protein
MRRSTGEIAAEWRELVDPPYRWTKCRNQAGALDDYREGEGGGFFVQSDGLQGRRAYLKPRQPDAGRVFCRAAREKIASDLAAEVGVCVPPVVLARQFDVAGEENYVCVSLVMYPRQWSWGQVRGLLADRGSTPIGMSVAGLIPKSAAQGLAFDTWVGQTDHADHPHNIILGLDPADELDRRLVFLDYAMAMGVKDAWANGGYAKCAPAPFPAYMLQNLDRKALAETITVIENVPEPRIRDIVGRIPASYLPQEKGAVIADGLVARRLLIRSALAPHLEERQP